MASQKNDATGRSTGSPKRRRKTHIGGQFVWRLVEMLKSPAWRVLSLSARRVIERVEIELASHGGRENGRLPCTYEDFTAHGIDRHSIAPAIREAVALGFLEYEQGAGGVSEFKRPNVFRLTFRHTDEGGLPTDDWRKIKTIDEATSVAVAARRATSKPPRKKQKTDGGFYPIPMGETHTL